jgi:effector-binding domain-containing protein
MRRTVAMSALTEFFAEAFSETMRVLGMRGITPIGPPFGKYYGQPDSMVDVEAGFPVSAPIEQVEEIIPGSLPGGRVVEAEHVGAYEEMDRTYAAMRRFFADAGMTPGDVMWESYLTDPGAEPDPAKWRTLISWPVATSGLTPDPDAIGADFETGARRLP